MAAYGVASASRDWTPERIAAAVRALETWDHIIANVPGRTLKVGLCWFADMPKRALAGGAATGYASAPVNGLTQATLITENVWKNGLNKPGGAFDIIIYCNPLYYDSFYYGADKSGLKSDQHDFQSLLTHELGHALGFYTMVAAGGEFRTKKWLDPATKIKGISTLYTAYDSLMKVGDKDVVDLKAGSAKVPLGTGVALKGTDLLIYNPPTYRQGNSFHHVTHGTGKPHEDGNLVMSYTLGPGMCRRALAPTEIKLMKAMGWQTASAEQKK